MTPTYRFDRFELRPATRELLIDGQATELGSRAFDVLVVLLERHERLVTKDELLKLVWPGLVVEENNVQVQISSLRKLLGDKIIKTVPGRGYWLTAKPTQGNEIRPVAHPHNLPRALTRFIGFDDELGKSERIVVASRLVTLTGVGGCGKTRFAIELASRLLPKFINGAWIVDLAPLADPARLPSTVASTLRLMERPGRSIVDTLCDHVAGQQMLLVLDNCEHLVGACAALATTLLDRVSQLHILATSREALGLPGEQTLRIRPLSCPPPDHVDGHDRSAQFEAVRLFVDRASLAQPGFTLDAKVAPTIGDICRRLDGIPLAIELAAARIRVRSVDELRKMLDERFRLLVGGPKTAPLRQQTLHATIKWSFDLLPTDERQLLEQLSVFSGGWTLEGAVAVSGHDFGPFEMLERLTHLADKSLIVVRSEEGITRYSMLETIRQYGLEALVGTGAHTMTALRHLEYFVALAERLRPAFMTSSEREALECLAPELENIVQALRDCENLFGGPELGLRLVGALGQYWLSLGLLHLGCQLTTEALAMRGAQGPSAARLIALFEAERYLSFVGRTSEARDRAKECLALARLLHDDHVAAGALAHLGALTFELGDSEQGIALIEESLQLARTCADPEQIRRALYNLGGAHLASDNHALAIPLFEECLQIGRDQRDPHSAALAACQLALTYVSLGRVGPVWPLALEALDLSADSKSKMTMQKVLEPVTALAAAVKEWPTAARMLGAANAAQKMTGNTQHNDSQFWSSVVVSTRNSLRDVDFDAAYGAGHALTMEQAIDEAKAWLERTAPTEFQEACGNANGSALRVEPSG